MQTKIKTSRLTAILCGATMLFSAAFSAQAATYKSANGFQFTPPAGWTQRKAFMGTEVVYLHSSGTNISAVSQAIPPGVSLAQVRAASLAQLRQAMTGYKLVSQGNTRLGGGAAAFIDSSYMMGTPAQKMRAYQVYAVRGGKLFVFTCTAKNALYPKYKAAFMKTLNSVRWTK